MIACIHRLLNAHRISAPHLRGRWTVIILSVVAVFEFATPAYPYAFDSFGGLQSQALLPQTNIRRWPNNTFSWFYDETNQPAGLGSANADALATMQAWANHVNISVPGAEAANAPAARVRISWEDFSADADPNNDNALGLAGPDFDGGGNLVSNTIRLNSDVAFTWNITGLKNVLSHEYGHALGLVDIYNDASNTAEDFIDHRPGGDGQTGAAKGTRDNVMFGYGTTTAVRLRRLDNDDINGGAFLFGGKNNNTIVTGAWNTVLGTDPGKDGIIGDPMIVNDPNAVDDYPNYFQQADHHGADASDPGPLDDWRYALNISMPAANTVIEIPAVQVSSVALFNSAGFTIDILTNKVRLTGPANFTGNLAVTINSHATREALRAPTLNGVVYDDRPRANGRQPLPQIWVPVPEPSSLTIVLVSIAMLGISRRPKSAA